VALLTPYRSAPDGRVLLATGSPDRTSIPLAPVPASPLPPHTRSQARRPFLATGRGHYRRGRDPGGKMECGVGEDVEGDGIWSAPIGGLWANTSHCFPLPAGEGLSAPERQRGFWRERVRGYGATGGPPYAHTPTPLPRERGLKAPHRPCLHRSRYRVQRGPGVRVAPPGMSTAGGGVQTRFAPGGSCVTVADRCFRRYP
jgi:hypothetical protein